MTDEGNAGTMKSDDIFKRAGSRWQQIFLIVSAAVFVIALGVGGYFIMSNTAISEDRIRADSRLRYCA